MINRIILVALLMSIFGTLQADTYYLKNNNPNNNWNDPCNWYTNPADINGTDCIGYPGALDDVVINGHSFINIQNNTTINSLSHSGFGTIGGNFEFRILQDANIYTYCGVSTGRMYIDGDLYFRGGSIGGTDSAFVYGHTYFIGGAGISKPLVMVDGGEWQDSNIGVSTTDGFLINGPGAVFFVHNTLHNVSIGYDSGGEFKNYGTLIKDSPYNLTFNAPASMTNGEMHLYNGITTFSNAFPVTNSQITVEDGATLFFSNGSRTFNNSHINSAGLVKLGGANTFNADCTASFDTLQVAGTNYFYISPVVPHLLMNGGVSNFYEDFTITASFWWVSGHLYGGARITCYPEAQLTEDGGTASYTSCKFDFLGGASWTSGSFAMYGGAEFNIPKEQIFYMNFNTGQSISIAAGSTSPFGTINLKGNLEKVGTGVAGLNVIFNSDTSNVNIYGGGMNLYRGTHHNSYFWINTGLVVQCTNIGNNFYHSQITGQGILRETGFNSLLDSLTTLDCNLEITGGTLTVNTDITPISLKMTGGTLNGSGNIFVAGNFDWTAFSLIHGSGTIDVQGFTTMSGTGGRQMYKQLILNGNGSWTGNFTIAFSSTGIIRVPVNRTLTLSPTTTINNVGTQTAVCGFIVEGNLVKTTNFEFDMQGADLTNNGFIEGIGTFRTWNYAFVHPNTGTLSPGFSGATGTLNWSGLFENKPSGNLLFDVQLTGNTINADSLRFLHDVTFGGNLTVNADPCWPSFTKTIISWAGNKTGSFANIYLPDNYTIVIDNTAKKVNLVHVQPGVAITCPANITTVVDPGLCTANVALGQPTNDNTACFSSLVFSNNAPSNFNPGMTTVTWTATGQGGATGTCLQTVTVSVTATEICNGIDDDCDGLTDNADPSVTGQDTYYADNDNDGYGAGAAILSCSPPANSSTNNTDCDDGNGSVHPGATEICNLIDDDCDNSIDENGMNVYYADIDGDGYGAGAAINSCEPPVGSSLNNTDCNNHNADIHPGATETCNGDIDDDCNGLADNDDPAVIGQSIYYADTDHDSYGAGAEVLSCTQPVHSSLNNTDCNDSNPAVHPGATDNCNSIDDDCDLSIDEDGMSSYYTDADGDGFGAGAAVLSCTPPANSSLLNTDCNDSNAAIKPGATELCNGIDDNCNSFVDDVTTCPKPTGLLTSNISYNGATISWTALPCAVSYEYRLRYLLSPGVYSAWSAWIPANTNSEALYDLMSNTTYQWSVRALCGTPLPSAISAIKSFKTCIPHTFYADTDNDGYGDFYNTILTCSATAPAGYKTNSADCNDENAGVYPGAAEFCDGLDNDCDGHIEGDEGFTYYADVDADGFGDPGATTFECTLPSGYVVNAADCNDADAAIKPGVTELCDGIDNNCDGIVDNVTTCPKPTGLSISNVMLTSATIGWDAIPCAVNGYQYRLRAKIGGVFTAYGPWIPATENTVELSGLLMGTLYQYQVRTNCYGTNKFSVAATSMTFTTLTAGLISAGDGALPAEAEWNNGYAVVIYPNPSDGRCTTAITSEFSGAGLELIVTDGLGNILQQHHLVLDKGLNQQEIDLTAYPDAMYIIELQTEKGIVHYPVVKSTN